MKRKLVYELKEKYPSVYGHCARWSIKDGWAGVLDELGRDLTETPTAGVEITRLSEKYGFLDADYKGWNGEAEALINKASDLSETTCEICGQPGRIDPSRTILLARCDSCRMGGL